MPTTMSVDESITILKVPGHGAEDVVVGDDGAVYTGTEDGSVFRVRADGAQVDRVGNTGGRPLGIELLAGGLLLVCDAHRGLLTLDPESGAVEPLLDSVGGAKMVFCNNAAVHSDGTIFFSDSSRVHPIDRWKAEVLEDTHSGRLLRRRPDGEVDVLVDGLRFANGVALSADESYVAVAETGGRTVVRRWLTGAKRGQVDLLADDLPGYPDNIARGSDGLIWVTLASPTDPVVERLMKAPKALQRFALALPDALQPKPKRTARVLAFSDDGRLVHDRSLKADGFHMVTGVREHRGRVWLGSLHEPAIAYFTL